MSIGLTTRSLSSAREIAAQIRRKEVSPVEVARLHLDRIERLNPKLNAFVDCRPDLVLIQAREAEAAVQRGYKLGPLHGLPLSIKSSIDISGHRCEAGSRLRAGYIASSDAPLVARLRAAGAVILGVTNTPELLMAWETDNLLYGRTNNPWGFDRTPGGSSGGEAAAIAAGLSAGGGDLHLLFEVMAGADDGDPCSAPVVLREVNDKELRATKIGFFEEDDRTPVTAETRSCVSRAASLLSSAGFTVHPFRPEGLEETRQLWWKFFGTAGGMILSPMLRGHEKELSPILREFFLWTTAEPAHSGDSLLATWLGRDDVRERILTQMRQYPVLLCPTAAIPAFRHGEREWLVGGKTVKYLDAWSYCEWFNLLGFPAVVVPMGFSSEGLPIGVQIVGRPWEEELVLAVASKLEKAAGTLPAPPLAQELAV